MNDVYHTVQCTVCNIKNNFQLFSEFILENPPFFEFVPNTITKDNKSVLVELLNEDEELFEYISLELSSDKDFGLEAVKLNPELFEYLPNKLQLDKEIVLETCKSAEKIGANGVEVFFNIQSWIYESESEDLLSDIDFAMDLLKICPWAGEAPTLTHLSDSLRSNKKV